MPTKQPKKQRGRTGRKDSKDDRSDRSSRDNEVPPGTDRIGPPPVTSFIPADNIEGECLAYYVGQFVDEHAGLQMGRHWVNTNLIGYWMKSSAVLNNDDILAIKLDSKDWVAERKDRAREKRRDISYRESETVLQRLKNGPGPSKPRRQSNHEEIRRVDSTTTSLPERPPFHAPLEPLPQPEIVYGETFESDNSREDTPRYYEKSPSHSTTGRRYDDFEITEDVNTPVPEQIHISSPSRRPTIAEEISYDDQVPPPPPQPPSPPRERYADEVPERSLSPSPVRYYEGHSKSRKTRDSRDSSPIRRISHYGADSDDDEMYGNTTTRWRVTSASDQPRGDVERPMRPIRPQR